MNKFERFHVPIYLRTHYILSIWHYVKLYISIVPLLDMYLAPKPLKFLVIRDITSIFTCTAEATVVLLPGWKLVYPANLPFHDYVASQNNARLNLHKHFSHFGFNDRGERSQCLLNISGN